MMGEIASDYRARPIIGELLYGVYNIYGNIQYTIFHRLKFTGLFSLSPFSKLSAKLYKWCRALANFGMARCGC